MATRRFDFEGITALAGWRAGWPTKLVVGHSFDIEVRAGRHPVEGPQPGGWSSLRTRGRRTGCPHRRRDSSTVVRPNPTPRHLTHTQARAVLYR